ncbi:MAG TPA: glycine cleavage system protein GcvH [Stackebrandtia sp.]|jgi:glycine cleavage system H protein|uniref:glycine cleavage system protein GcvH n=1 Tax=Stackebrandtia sp. TaxID=2023065 RepID=UPI002D26CE73|nr:glycine cleavage system protein GcvH [Stackebrandtia sp.]HZE37187.1 glycine cleavage system protein GcvH [Stackebrandtia sp.]
MIPQELRYTAEHEWVRPSEGAATTVRVGITDYAQSSLGDIVFVQLPNVGDKIAANDAIGEVESTKSVSDIYAPLAGTVTAVNESLDESPETINSAPYEAGWLFDIEPDDVADVAGLLDSEAYAKLTE